MLFSHSLPIIWRVICADLRTLRTVSPLNFTRGVGFLSKSNPGKCHYCYVADHFWISVTGFWFPCFMWSRLWIYAAIPVVFDCKQTMLKQVMEKSKEVLVLTGLVVECVWLILHSPFIFLHVPILFGLCMRGLIKVNQKLSPFFSPARVYRGWPYVKRQEALLSKQNRFAAAFRKYVWEISCL